MKNAIKRLLKLLEENPNAIIGREDFRGLQPLRKVELLTMKSGGTIPSFYTDKEVKGSKKNQGPFRKLKTPRIRLTF